MEIKAAAPRGRSTTESVQTLSLKAESDSERKILAELSRFWKNGGKISIELDHNGQTLILGG